MIGAAGDRRDDDMRELGSVAAEHFDVIVVREDDRLRGRKRGVTAELVAEGVRVGDGRGSALPPGRDRPRRDRRGRHVMARANPGDLVVMCVDQHAAVISELETMTQAGPGRAAHQRLVGDPDLDPAELARDAEAQGQEAEVEALAADHEAAEEAEESEEAEPARP